MAMRASPPTEHCQPRQDSYLPEGLTTGALAGCFARRRLIPIQPKFGSGGLMGSSPPTAPPACLSDEPASQMASASLLALQNSAAIASTLVRGEVHTLSYVTAIAARREDAVGG